MYTTLKNSVKKLLPKKLLFRFEPFFRKLLRFHYKGNNYQCPVCETKLNTFIQLEKGDLLCPACGSRSRSRRLLQLLKENKLIQGKVLDFSPPRGIYEFMKKALKRSYYPTDFENQFLAHYHYDITAIPHQDAYFDLILCYHILEHIPEDTKAMAELYRVLKPQGVCYIQTPFKNGAIYEDASIISEAGRLKAYGQEDHVRVYSVEGLKQRLEQVGFKVKATTYEAAKNDYNGLKSETIITACK